MVANDRESAAVFQPRTGKHCPEWAGWLMGVPVLAALTGWEALAVYYSNLPEELRPWGAGAVVLANLLVLLRVRPASRTIALSAVVFVALVAWWLDIPPSNHRDWQPDVAKLPWAAINGNRVTVHNIRNCDYRSETDYTVRHYNKTYDVKKLQSVDLFLVYWGSPAIAHTMFSFGFEGGDYLCFSIETRKRKGQAYSAIKGFFKQYELTYVVGDERDLVGLRTHHRNEDVYLYRLKAPADMMRTVFLDYLRTVNQLKHHPEWYNALTSNCTTNIRGHTRPYNPRASWDWRILVNGYVDEMAYEQGVLDRSLSFRALRSRSHINQRARSGEIDPHFSRRIREGLPGT